jgi:hypothetical protein
VIGVELTSPSAITVDAINAVMTRVGQPRARAEEMAPLRAAQTRRFSECCPHCAAH